MHRYLTCEGINRKHITTPVINGDESTSASQALSSQAPTPKIPLSLSELQMRRSGRPFAQHVNTASNIHSRHDPFAVDYGLWPFDDTDYDIVCAVTNSSSKTNLSLWTSLLTEDARRQACAQYNDRCCNCGCTDRSLRWCPSPFNKSSPYSTRSSSLLTRMAPCLEYGSGKCALAQ